MLSKALIRRSSLACYALLLVALLSSRYASPPRALVARLPSSERRGRCVGERAAELGRLFSERGLSGLAAARTSAAPSRTRAVALVVPIHPPKFELGRLLLATRASAAEGLSWDILFVFSSAGDAAAFNASLSPQARGDSYQALVVPHADLPLLLPINKTGTINFKKWYGALLAFPCYEHLVTVDSELYIDDALGLAQAVRKAALRGLVYMVDMKTAQETWDVGRCGAPDGHAVCASSFHGVYVNSIARLPRALRAAAARATRGCELFGWYADMPYYISADIPAFLADVRFPEELPIFCEFDHAVYQMWKVARAEWRIADISNLTGWADHIFFGQVELPPLPEIQKRADAWAAVRTQYYPGPLWRPQMLCYAAPEACTVAAGSFARYHIDR